MWTKIAGIILRNRIAFITGVLLGTVFMGFQARHIQMSYESADLLPKTDTAYLDYAKFRETFGQEGNIMVFAIQDSNFYDLAKINDWIAMGNNIKALKGVTALMSITHTFNLHKNTELKKFEIQPIFPHHISSKAELDSLSFIAENLPFYDGLLLNKQKHTYNMMITVSAEVMNSPARVKLVQDVLKITEQFTGKHHLKMHYSGMPYIRVINAENIKGEMYMFIALSLLITAIILYLFFRSFRIVGFCVGIIGLSVIWAIGFMAILGIKITLLTAMLPPLLIVIGIPNCVYMVNKYHTEYVRHGNKIKALQRMIQKVGNASLLSNLTTAAGFATFIITSSRILVEFGLIAFISITCVFLICLILIPTVFSYLPVPDTKQTKHLYNPFINHIIEKIIYWVINKRHTIYYITAILVLAGIYGITQMKTTGYMVDDLKDTDPIRQDLAFFESNFDGLMPLEITIDFGKPNQVFKLSNLEKLDLLDKELSQDPDLSKALSVVEAAKFANQAYYNGKAAYYKLPNNMTKNFIMKYVMESTGGMSDMAKSFVDSTLREVRLSFRVKDIGTKKMEAKEDSLYQTITRIFPEDKHKISVTGSSIIFFKGNQYLLRNLFSSLALAIILIAGFMAWMFKSKRMVFIALLPNVIPQIITAAIMGYIGIPIKASTILVFSVAFGISVDNTIHYLAKYRQELQATNWSIRSSVVLALQETGQSMIYTSIILFFGFSIFCLSSFGGTFALGLLTSITLFGAMLANLLLLPSLLLTMEHSITKRTFRAEPLLQIFNEEEDIDENKLEIKV
ncbi:RND family transporter [Odoribacter sp. Z80]|uniref:efflux RND transporter permease subunit n=1 Tax=Odoribacter sp. Z80 TaxID=2304575 RepID=UPI001379A2E6|nr:MMPL family transporter [Odoribacter sp. Z80]NCE72210.1 RND family transporter [Odoribacter sp. Z80]